MTDFNTETIVADVEPEARAKARKVIERHALDSDDFQMLVDMLGIS